MALVPGDLDGHVASTAFCVLRANRFETDPRYLYFCLLPPWTVAQISARERGASYPAVTDKDVLEQTVLVPPLEEQRAISDVLSSAQAAVSTQEHVVAKLKELKAATMARMLRDGVRAERLKDTEIGEMPESWDVVRLGDVAKVGNGSTPKRTESAFWTDGTIPWLTSAKVHEGTIQAADEFVTALAREECHLPVVPARSVVVAITGQGKTLGNVAMVTFETCVSQHLAYVSCQTPEIVPGFLLAYLQSRYQYFRQVASAGGSTKGALTCGLIADLGVPQPPTEEQQAIASVHTELDQRIRSAVARLGVLRSLFAAVLPALMSGEVRLTQCR